MIRYVEPPYVIVSCHSAPGSATRKGTIPTTSGARNAAHAFRRTGRGGRRVRTIRTKNGTATRVNCLKSTARPSISAAETGRRRDRNANASRRQRSAGASAVPNQTARTASGVDANRVALLVAVLGRRAGIGLASHDIYVNLAGGLTVDEPGLDLPLALALASSLRDRAIPSGTVAIGEVGLLGELRSVVGLERRLREASRLGFGRAIVPRPGRGPATPDVAGMDVLAVGSLREAIEAALSDESGAPRRMAAASARC